MCLQAHCISTATGEEAGTRLGFSLALQTLSYSHERSFHQSYVIANSLPGGSEKEKGFPFSSDVENRWTQNNGDPGMTVRRYGIAKETCRMEIRSLSTMNH